MVAYSTPPTFASPWNFSDANTYLRDNLDCDRRLLRSHFYIATVVTVTSVATVVYTSPPLLTAALTEITNLQVLVYAQYQSTVSGAPNVMAWRNQDQAGTTIGLSVIGWPNAHKNICQMGATNVASGTNPQFRINANNDTGSASWLFICEAWVTPTTT